MAIERIAGRVAVLTGASRGLGPHIAHALAAQGVNLALVARDQHALERLATELRARGIRAEAIAADLMDLAGLDAVLERAGQALGGIDILINNAGADGIRVFSEESEQDTERLLRLNLLVPILLARKALPKMLAQKAGHIVNIASLAGKNGTPFNVSYASSKAGVIGFTYSLRAELHGTGVSASVISPGFVQGDGMWAKQEQAHGVRVSPLLGTSKPEEVARAVIKALRSDRAEIVVNPGPMRLVQALQQLMPEQTAWVQRRWLGVDGMLKGLALARDASSPGGSKRSSESQ